MFDCGKVLPSKLSLKKAKSLEIDLIALIQKHCAEDWPDLTPFEIKLNQEALEKHRPVFARYKIKGSMFIINTEFASNEAYTTYIHMIEEL